MATCSFNDTRKGRVSGASEEPHSKKVIQRFQFKNSNLLPKSGYKNHVLTPGSFDKYCKNGIFFFSIWFACYSRGWVVGGKQMEVLRADTRTRTRPLRPNAGGGQFRGRYKKRMEEASIHRVGCW